MESGSICNEELLNLRFNNGMLMLPYYRCLLKNHSNQKKKVRAKEETFIKKLFKRIKGLKKIGLKKRDILIFSNARWEKFEDERWKNILHGYYYDLYPDKTLLMEGCDNHSRWATYDSYENMSTIGDVMIIFARILAVVFNAIYPVKNESIKKFNTLYPFITKKQIAVDDYFIRIYSTLILCLFKIVKPKIILMLCGSYGGAFGVICKIAKEQGIATIDTQHGQIYHHDAYTTSEMERDSDEMLDYLPDYLFSYGDYWSRYVDWRYNIIPVGNPYLNEYAIKYSNNSDEIDFLVISQPYEKSSQISFVLRLSELFPQSSITYRLHPEESIEEHQNVFQNNANVCISDSHANLYYDFARSKNVIGWRSTALIEYLVFGKQPFIVRSKLSEGFFPEDIGIWIDNAEDIILYNSINEHNAIDCSKYWSPDFNTTVKKVIDSILYSV